MEETKGASFQKKHCFRRIEVLLIIVSLFLLIGVFCLPIVFHYTDSTTPTNITSLQEKLFAIQRNSSLNQSYVININASNVCESELLSNSWSNRSFNGSSACSSYTYSGSICQPYLQVWQSCVDQNKAGSSSAVSIQADPKDAEEEETLTTLSGLLSALATPECQADALPFLCQYSFPLSNCETGRVYQASKEECIRISTTICSTVWALAISSGYQNALPVCSELPEANSYPTYNDSTQSVIAYNVTELDCADHFTVINATCHAKCHEFSQNPYPATVFLLTAELLSAIVVIVLSGFCVVFFIKNKLKVFSYPSFLIIFTTCNMLLQAILVIISAIDRGDLYCSSPDVISSFDHPTAFAFIAGAINHYLLINLVLWWFCHLLLFTSRLVFPKQTKNAARKGLHRYISTSVLLFCFLSPLVAVIIAVVVPRAHSYRLQRLPSGVPTSSTKLWFYSVIFPYCIFLAGGIWMLLADIWILLKRKISKYFTSSEPNRAEWSFLFYFAATAVYLIIFTIYSSLWTVNYNNLTRTLTEYFLCEVLGTSSATSSCSRAEFEAYSYPYFQGFTALCGIFVLVGVLVVAINSKAIETRENESCCSPLPDKVTKTNVSATNPAYYSEPSTSAQLY